MDEEEGQSSDYSSLSFTNTPQYLPLSENSQPAIFSGSYSYPAWDCQELPIEDIAVLFNKVTKVLGFQQSSSANIFELLMSQLDSRASRSDPITALRSLHADYIAGPHSNYRKWYFASKMDLKDLAMPDNNYATYSLEEAIGLWRERCIKQTNYSCLVDITVYLLCWGEANQIRYMPECLAFIYKCARDFFQKVEDLDLRITCLPNYYLDSVITPIYSFYVRQNFEDIGGDFVRREQDHSHTIGYDDINQLFWYYDSLKTLKVGNISIVSIPTHERYLELAKINWDAAARKSYYEYRTWFHVVTNFSRVFILHASAFWYYTAFNSPALYTFEFSYRKGPSPTAHIQWTTVALGGLIGPLLTFLAVLGECLFMDRNYPGAQPVCARLIVLMAAICILLAPSLYIYLATSWESFDKTATVVAGLQSVLALISTVYYSTVPLHDLLGAMPPNNPRDTLANFYFTANFQHLSKSSCYLSWLMVGVIYAAKLTESYFFLTLSVRDPILELFVLRLSENCIGDVLLGPLLCKAFPRLILAAVYVLEFILFFLDTYLWYVLINTLVSVMVSLRLGASIWTPWRNVYSRLPKRIASKILVDKNALSVKMLWNAIVQNMVLDHLVSPHQAEELSYTRKWDSHQRCYIAAEPVFFTAEEDGTHALPNKETQRRISFFAQSLAQPIPETTSAESMPSFTVLVPHFSEKILLSLKESIRNDDQQGKVTVLEYLQKLYPTEWQHFIESNKSYAFHYRSMSESTISQQNELLMSLLGFTTSRPEDTNKTRMWCSSRSQTLYKTVAGLSNYISAVKLLYYSGRNDDKTPDLKVSDSEIDAFVNRKVRILVAMQRYSTFNQEQVQDTELLFQLFPHLSVAYIDIETRDDGRRVYYSSYIDGKSAIINGRRQPKYRVQISGNPILGDGKSDNQNHALIYYRGEYIQLIDSNQDHYIEECLKIRNLLAEFEETTLSPAPYDEMPENKVAIVGAREYIFSENVGVLGDVAAGKEQTFGTLFARAMAQVGGKLHYGHPDFLHSIFVTTRGGVSKGQKSLHLNEDIFAGMMVLCRGGRIKHAEYVQCGKGRDLGFVSILNFTTKIGAGMGEQMLSREYFWLGSQLPFDRFISFYYGHAGFHLNNVFIVSSIKLFLIVLMWIGVINGTTRQCKLSTAKNQLRLPPGCIDTTPLKEWLSRRVGSIITVFVIAQLPLLIQELSEKGLAKSLLRICKHYLSLSMLFEIFVCQVYASAFIGDLSLGGAKYISTGRGFATARVPLTLLYQGYAISSIQFGAQSLVALSCISAWFFQPAILWFWITAVALCICPVLFNPHQLNSSLFFLDYRRTLSWFSHGGWVTYVRQQRAKITGYQDRVGAEADRSATMSLLCTQLIIPCLDAAIKSIPYIYLGSQRLTRFQKRIIGNPILRLSKLCALSLSCNVAALALGLLFSLLVAPINVKSKVRVASTFTYMFALTLKIGVFNIVYLVNNRSYVVTIVCILALSAVERLVLRALTLLVGKQVPPHLSDEPWWSLRWGAIYRFEARYWLLPLEEFVCKLCECSYFAVDFLVIHFLVAAQLPLLLIPGLDGLHSILLLWLSPSNSGTLPLRRAKQQRREAIQYALACISILAVLCTSLAVGAMLPQTVTKELQKVF